MRDFLPEDVRRRTYVIGVIAGVYQKYGFEPLETPSVENIETLLGKYGEEGNQLIFKILKRGVHESTGEADLALRYDLTVPLARVMAEHRAKLPRLFRRYQIQPVWRADRPGRGRFREFYQCDVDITGSTSPVVEAELCAAVSDCLEALGFAEFTIRLNHRGVLRAVLASAQVPVEKHTDALVALDKLDKIGPDGVTAEFVTRGIDPACAARLLGWLGAEVSDDWLGQFERGLGDLDDQGRAAFANLREIIRLSMATSAGRHLTFEPSLARGLSYYTGAIMEIGVPDLPGSLGGGGRYDNLVGMFSKEGIPSCGFSLGLERILVVMGEQGLFPASVAGAAADVLVATMRPEDAAYAMRVATTLRGQGLRVMVYPDAGKIQKPLKYAEEVRIPCVAILGESEVARDEVTLKFLASRHQEVAGLEQAGAVARQHLGDVRG